ncbi:MAG: DUF4357 domain-containing protein [Actinobacteria bacterium]|nr:DUF4357 domain-containing protein [Actinomycetota bacterium]
MAIADRTLRVGTELVGRYKGQTFRCTVTTTEDGSKTRYRLEDGREFKSPSSAASAVMNGKSANGWAFWSLAPEQAEVPATHAPEAAKLPTSKPPKSKAKGGSKAGKNGKRVHAA